MEEWPSGLRHRLGKAMYVQAYQGFESPFFRHKKESTCVFAQ
jgi:hypothetical protein